MNQAKVDRVFFGVVFGAMVAGLVFASIILWCVRLVWLCCQTVFYTCRTACDFMLSETCAAYGAWILVSVTAIGVLMVLAWR